MGTTEEMVPVIWYLTGSQNPYVRACEPGGADVSIPGPILEWAENLGLRQDEPDVYLLVTVDEFPGEVLGLMGTKTGQVPRTDAERIAGALRNQDAERAARGETGWPA